VANQVNDPPSPQSQVVTVASTNNTARVGPYTDTDITKRNVVSSLSLDTPAQSLPSSVGDGVRVVYAEDQAPEKANTEASEANVGVAQPAHAPNSWPRATQNGRRVSRNVYATNGALGQDEFN
jgi:hypothetical protein